MPLTVDQLLEIRFSRTLKGPEKVNAYRDLASKSLRFDREIREFAFCARCFSCSAMPIPCSRAVRSNS